MSEPEIVQPCEQNGLQDGATTAPSDLHPTKPGHRRNGQFALRNQDAVTHGGKRRQPVVDPTATALYAAWANDLGGAEELTAGERALLQRAVEADAIAAGAIRYLHRSHQSLTHPRTLAAVGVWTSASSQLRAIAQALGLKRRAKRLSPMAQFAEQPEIES